MLPLPAPGSIVDATPFAMIAYWTGSTAETIEAHAAPRVSGPSHEVWWRPVDVEEQGGPHIGLQWKSPRRFSRIIVRYAPGERPPDPASVKVQYWHRSWPQRGCGGWTEIDDQYNGRWATARAKIAHLDSGVSYSFLPLDKDELERDDVEPLTYRVAYKLRLLFPSSQTPAIESLQALADCCWKEVPVRIEFGCAAGSKVPNGGTMEIYNGYGKIAARTCGPDIQAAWKSESGNVLNAVALIADTDLDALDRTICTIRTDVCSFSFAPMELRSQPILLKDFGVLISTGIPYAEWKSPKFSTALPIYDRVAQEPEQSYERARRDIPRLIKTRHGPWGRYVPLGCDWNRQEIAVLYNGDILIDQTALKSKPTAREPLFWPESHLRYRIMGGKTPTRRDGEDETAQGILESYLPVVSSEWAIGGVRYRQENFAALLEHREADQRGDETTVMLGRVVLTNPKENPITAHLWIAMDHPEELLLRDNGFVLAAVDLKPGDGCARRPYETPRLRLYFGNCGKGRQRITSTSEWPSVLHYSVDLEPKGEHAIEYRIPFVTLDQDSWEALQVLDYNTKRSETVDYWRRQIASGATIEVPEPLLSNFNKAQFTHIAITADKDPLTGLAIAPAATFGYNVCANEAVHQVRSLEARGYHKRAEQYLEAFVKLQGTRALHGRYKSTEGALHGLRVSDDTDYQTFNYNLDHGFVLWMLAEHYKFTRDRRWAGRVAPNLIAACDFITRERKASMLTDAKGRKVWQYGLLPEGHLEDPPEFHHWYAVNSYAARGMRDAAEVLADIGHPEAGRIRRDADSFISDLRDAARESMIRAPVVRLLDGTAIPFQPTRCLLSGRDVGWIRDALYGPIHLIDCGVYEPDSREATWILKDAEDNVFPRPERGRLIEDMDRYWFSHGGITLQSNLLPNPLVYLKRGQPEHAIRAFYNSLAANLYPDVLVFCEHPIQSYGLGTGPFLKSPDESAFVVWLRHLLLLEIGDDLQITPGAPRAWFADGKAIRCEDMPSHFGPLSFNIASEAQQDAITAMIRPPKRNPPSVLELHLRHPDKKPIESVTVNGAPHKDFDAQRGVIRFPEPPALPEEVIVKAQY